MFTCYLVSFRSNRLLNDTPYLQNVINTFPIVASSTIEITEIDIGLKRFLFNNVFIVLLNYIS